MIEERYDNLSDTSPHEQYLLILSESETCFGSEYTALASEIQDRIDGDELTIQEYFHPLEDVTNSSRLIQNSVWLIHWDECLKNQDYPCLDSFLDQSMFPNYTEAIICIENGGYQKAKEIERKYRGISVAYSKDTLFSCAKIHFSDFNPTYTSGKERVKSWNNEICERLGI
jgi:hypothetical protein